MNSSITGECRVLMIPISNIRANRYSGRQDFSTDMRELRNSIEQAGILQPLTVRRIANGTYELIAGERRLRAAVAAGLSAVPCIVIHCSEVQAAVYTYVENAQRRNIDMFDEAEVLSTLTSEFHYTSAEISSAVGLPCACAEDKLSLLSFTHEERKIIREYSMTEKQALAFLKVHDIDCRKAVLHKAAENNLNLEQTEQLIERINTLSANERTSIARTVIIKDLRPFYNTINRSVKTLRMSGINAESVRSETDNRIEIKITIRK